MDAYSLGQMLREAREAREMELEDAVAKLRIRQPILEGFEAGEFDVRGMPEIQIRGLLRIYARYLELDEAHILLLFDQMRNAQEKGRRALLRRRRRRQEDETERHEGTQPLQDVHLADRRSSGCRRIVRALLLLTLSLLALGVIAYVTIELTGFELGEQAVDTGEATATAAPATDTATPRPRATATTLSPTASNRAQYSGSGILVSLLVTQRSWLQVQVDGVEQYSGIAPPDTLLEYSAIGEIALTAGNALGLDVFWNGQHQGQIGARGQSVELRFTLDEVLVNLGPAGAATPVSPTAPPTALPTQAPTTVPIAAEATSEPAETAIPSPPPTATPLPSATPLPPPTLTPLPSPSPVPSATPTLAETPLPTAILPPRVTQVGLPPTKPRA